MIEESRAGGAKTEASLRAVPLQAIALDAIERQPSSPHSPLLFPAERSGYPTCTTSAIASGSRHNVPPGSSLCAGSTTSVHTLATFALRAACSDKGNRG